MKQVLIADDHPIFRAGLRDIILNAYPEASVHECSDGEEAVREILRTHPDISILDIDMPKLSGLDTIKNVLKEDPTARMIILTMHRDKEMMKKAMLLGACGYLLKDFAVNELMDCISKVGNGRKYVGPALAAFYDDVHSVDKKKRELIEQLRSLTQAEFKTLRLVGKNHTTREIAERLFLSEKTIENYRSRICQKLGLPPRNNSLMLWISENRELLATVSEF